MTCLVRKNQMYITCRKKSILMSIVCLDCTAKHILRKIVHIRALLLISRTLQFVCFLKKIWQSNTPVSSYDGITSLCICPSKSVARKCCLRKLWDRCCMRGTVILFFLLLLNEYLSLMDLILSV